MNEAKLLPYFFRHYDDIVDAYFFLDDSSTDDTREIIKANPKASVEVVHFGGKSKVLSANMVVNEMWKKSKGVADWVIVVDVDEHLCMPNLKDYLSSCASDGITVIPTVGFDMISLEFPGPDDILIKSVRNGLYSELYSKTAIFNPNAIEDMNYSMGAHFAIPEGRAIYPIKPLLALLHFKNLGFDYVCERANLYKGMLRVRDEVNRFGHQYWNSEEDRYQQFKLLYEQSYNALVEFERHHVSV